MIISIQGCNRSKAFSALPSLALASALSLALGGNSGGGSLVIHLDSDSHLSILVNRLIAPHYSSLCFSDRAPSVCLRTQQEIQPTHPPPKIKDPVFSRKMADSKLGDMVNIKPGSADRCEEDGSKYLAFAGYEVHLHNWCDQVCSATQWRPCSTCKLLTIACPTNTSSQQAWC